MGANGKAKTLKAMIVEQTHVTSKELPKLNGYFEKLCSIRVPFWDERVLAFTRRYLKPGIQGLEQIAITSQKQGLIR